MIERIFKAYDIRATYPDMINEDTAWKVGYATALLFQRSRGAMTIGPTVKMEDTIAVGRDMRAHSPSLSAALSEGIRAAGMNVIELGPVDTPFVYFAVNHLDCVGGIQVTGSHSPAQYAGFKLTGPRAKPIGNSSGLEDIRRIASTLRVGKTGLRGSVQTMDLWSEYRRHVLQFLHLERKLRVAVDASNGMAGWMIPAIFDNIPELEIIPLLFETDGAFVHEPDPLNPANLQMLREKMAATTPDLGVCFDGDADRCVFMDEKGEAIGPDRITALIAKDLLSRPENKGAAIIYDLRSSHVVPEEIAAAGGQARRDRCGHTFIKRTLTDTEALFAGEITGRYYFRDNFNTDSAAIAFAQVLSIISHQTLPISASINPLNRYIQSGELSFPTVDKDTRIRDLADRYRKFEIDYLDGITVDCGDWWFNVRKSNSRPVLRLNMECATAEMLAEKLAELKAFLGPDVAYLA